MVWNYSQTVLEFDVKAQSHAIGKNTDKLGELNFLSPLAKGKGYGNIMASTDQYLVHTKACWVELTIKTSRKKTHMQLHFIFGQLGGAKVYMDG